LIPPAAAYTGISPGAYKFQAGFGGHYGRGGGGALLAAPFYYPYLGYGSSLNTFPGYNEQIDPNAQAFAAAQDSLGEQIRQLSEELDSVRRQVVTPPTPPVAPATPQPPPAMVPYGGDPASASQPPIVVVLKNGQRLPVQSYAVMNGLIWDFSKQPVRKIPVSTVDIAESVKASEANGTEFPDLSSASRVSVSHWQSGAKLDASVDLGNRDEKVQRLDEQPSIDRAVLPHAPQAFSLLVKMLNQGFVLVNENVVA
jgi:hypothetical protein